MAEQDEDDFRSLMEKLLLIAQQVLDGEKFLNCVLQRTAGRINTWPEEDMACSINIRGDAAHVYKPSERRLRERFDVKAAADLAEYPVLLSRLGGSIPEVDRRRATVKATMMQLIRDATVECAKAA